MSEPRCVVLIERQDFWRRRCASALQERGYSVLQFATYDVEGRLPSPAATDLVVLGCTTVGPAEVCLIGEIRRLREPVLLVCTLAEPRAVRAGFTAGAGDVVERCYDAAGMVATVDRALAAAPPMRAPRPAAAGEPLP
jgi:DNA-binding response OmpR family regulator